MESRIATSRANLALVPFDPHEGIAVAEAARIADKSEDWVRRWAVKRSLGRKIGGVFKISGPAWRMFLDGDEAALALYHDGDRENAGVIRYFERCGVVPPIEGRGK